jgi:zinc D-Ala-D-Ala carboxypeptidase
MTDTEVGLIAVGCVAGGVIYYMRRPSEHFTWEELTASSTAESLGLDNTPGLAERLNLIRLAREILEPLREEFGAIKVNSAYRSPEVNEAIGGADDSKHMLGLAADITAYAYPEVTNDDMATWLWNNGHDLPLQQVITYEDTTHLHVALDLNSPPKEEFLVHTADGLYLPWSPNE